ncbi:MAG TPA: 3-phosphoshikimate 1-carboxyvinyltransferase [Gemmatimonadaceae bacterium]
MKKLRVGGSVRAASDKSISHRALMLAAVSKGKTRISHILPSDDVRSTAAALRALGAAIPPLSDEFFVTGQSARFLKTPADALDCGNSGTTARLMSGVVAGAGVTAKFIGDASLSRRPMRRVTEPLREMGAGVSLAEGGGLPMTIFGAPLRAIEWTSPVASAQIKSAIILAAVLAGVRAVVTEPHRSRDHTERMLGARGVHVRVNGNRVEVDPGQIVRPADVAVPADPSAAAYFVALALLAGAGELRLTDVCLNPTRTGFYSALKRMGADIEFEDRREEGGDVVGTIVARPSILRAVDIAADEVPSMIDELPLLACLASRADGVTTVRGAAELRVKESDRIATIVTSLNKLGATASELADGFTVSGSNAVLEGEVDPRADHRIAMSFGILARVAGNEIAITDRECVSVSFPGFWDAISAATQ